MCSVYTPVAHVEIAFLSLARLLKQLAEDDDHQLCQDTLVCTFAPGSVNVHIEVVCVAAAAIAILIAAERVVTVVFEH